MSLVPLDRQVRLDYRAKQEASVARERPEQRDSPVKRVLRVLLALQDLREAPELRVRLASLGLRALLDSRDQPDNLVHWGNQAFKAQLVRLEHKGLVDKLGVLERLEQLDLRALVDHKVPVAAKAQMVTLVYQDLWDQLVPLASQDPVETLDSQDLRGSKANKEPPASLVLLDPLGSRDNKVWRAALVIPVSRGQLVQQDRLDRKEQRVSQAQMAIRARRALQVRLEALALKEPLEAQALPDLLDKRAPPDQRVTLVKRVSLD